MNILVTGGGGYIGSTLVPILLEQGHRIRVLDALLYGGAPLLPVWSHPRFEFLRAEIADSGAVRSALNSIDAVVHLAAVVGDPACAKDPQRARAVNLEGSLALLEAARQAHVGRFVFASTCSNYGKMKDPEVYVDETSELAPISLYAETKVAVERAVIAAGNGSLCATALRFATVYGVSPRMRFDLTVNEFTMEMLTKKKLVVFGEQFWRPYIHVRDAARGIACVLSAPTDQVAGEVFNVGSTEENYRKVQIVDIARAQAPDAVVEFVHRNEDPRDYRVSFAKIVERLGFRLTKTVPQGIEEVAALVSAGILQDWDNARYRNS
jgi:nucleoside-diphosphate-sugar epimerase